MSTKATIVTVDGNVGAGKTSFLNEMRSRLPGFEIELEPVDQWMSMRVPGSESSLFDLYYADPAKYAFPFQIMALETRSKQLLEMCGKQNAVVLCERSFLTDYKIFAQLMSDKGFISPIEMEVYKRWHGFVSDLVKPNIAGMVYLRAGPQTCMERIRKRGRQGEGNIEIDYLQELHEAHENWLGPAGGATLTIDVEGAVDYDAAAQQIAALVQKAKTMAMAI